MRGVRYCDDSLRTRVCIRSVAAQALKFIMYYAGPGLSRNGADTRRQALESYGMATDY